MFGHSQTGEPYDASQVRKRLYAAMEAAGTGIAAGARADSLRHVFGTRMAAAGVPMRALQEWMGASESGYDRNLCGLRARSGLRGGVCGTGVCGEVRAGGH